MKKIKLSESAQKRIKEIEVKRKELADLIDSIKRTDSVRVSEVDRKKMEKIYEAYIDATTVVIPVELTVLIDEDGSINDVCEERVWELVDDNLVKQSDVNKLRAASKKVDREAARLAKKYNTDSETIKELCC